LALTSLWKYTN